MKLEWKERKQKKKKHKMKHKKRNKKIKASQGSLRVAVFFEKCEIKF